MDVYINDESALISVQKLVREACAQIGLGLTDTTRLVTAASELARNILQHAGNGCMSCTQKQSNRKTGLELIFRDEGPGIPDVDSAMQPGFSTSSIPSLGLGLPGTRRLVDSMEIDSQVGQGTTVKICKWQYRNVAG